MKNLSSIKSIAILILSSNCFTLIEKNQIQNHAKSEENRILFEEAKISINENKLDKAIYNLNKIIDSEPTYWMAYHNRGICYYLRNDFNLAIEDFNRSLIFFPDSILSLSMRANSRLNLKQNYYALNDFEKIVSLEDSSPDVFIKIGDIQFELKQYEKAISNYSKSLRRSINYKTYIKRGKAKLKNKEYLESIEDFEEAIKLEPKNILAFLNRANAKGLNNDPKGSDNDFNLAIKLSPKDPEIYKMRGLLKSSLNKKLEAIKDLTLALEISNENAMSKDELDFNDGKIVSRIIITKNKTRPRKKYSYSEGILYYTRGNIYFDLEKYEDALYDYNFALDVIPNYGIAYSNRGSVLMNLRRYEEAILDFTKAIDLNSNDGFDHLNRAISKFYLNQIFGACMDMNSAKSLKKSLDDAPDKLKSICNVR